MDYTIIKDYQDGKTLNELADKHNILPTVIKRFLTKNGVIMRPSGHQTGKVAWNRGIPSEKKIDTIFFIESGKYQTHNDTYVRTRMKAYRIIKYGHICELCRNETWNSFPIPLVCDHIDGNSENTDLSNFRNICPNCDALLPTYKGRNKGNGRIARRGLSKQKFTKKSICIK